jgi:hypothetical protein
MTPNEEKKLLKDKAKKVKDKKDADYGNERFAVATRFGEVQIETLDVATDSEGRDYVEVFLAGDTENSDPHFKIWNPPLLVKDPDGTLREDPIQAIAEVIAGNGGRATKGSVLR